MKPGHNCFIDEALQNALPLAAVAPPAKPDIEFLRLWLKRPAMGNSFLRGDEETIWDAANEKDLITLHPAVHEADKLTKFLNEKMLDVYHSVIGRRRKVCLHGDVFCLEERCLAND
jgi:hypothetical protein